MDAREWADYRIEKWTIDAPDHYDGEGAELCHFATHHLGRWIHHVDSVGVFDGRALCADHLGEALADLLDRELEAVREKAADYGPGDGSTTFNLPDMRDRLPMGASATRARGFTGGGETAS